MTPVRRLLDALALVARDYERCYRVRREPAWRRWALALPRLTFNPSLHAVVLIRLALAGPRPLMVVWRPLLLAKHAIDLDHRCRIGPGFYLPHPFGIVLGAGATIGADVLLYHNVSVGGWALDGRGRPPVVGDGVTVYSNSVIADGVRVGAGALVGTGCVIEEDIAAGAVVGREGVVSRDAG